MQPPIPAPVVFGLTAMFSVVAGMIALLVIVPLVTRRKLLATFRRELGLRSAKGAESADEFIRTHARSSELTLGERGVFRVELDLSLGGRSSPRTRVLVAGSRPVAGTLWLAHEQHRPMLLSASRSIQAGGVTYLIYGDAALAERVFPAEALALVTSFPRPITNIRFETFSVRLEWLRLERDPQIVERAFRLGAECLERRSV